MSKPIKRIAINTGGGDAPGLNAVIQAVVIAAANRGWDCYRHSRRLQRHSVSRALLGGRRDAAHA